MRAGFVSCTISLTVHLAIAAAFLSVPIDRVMRHKSIALDFNIISGYGTESRGLQGGPGEKKNEEVKRTENSVVPAAAKKAAPAEKTEKTSRMVPVAAETVQDPKETITGTDENGLVSVAGAHRQVGTQVPAGTGAGTGVYGGGGTKTLDYSGPGGVDERNFSFIRDRIMQNIIYPEKARRMGWEGRVTLSFTVHENGSIADVRIINSSGFPLLDDNAREAVVRTNFKRKVPVRLVVLLPVEYRLR